MRRALVIGMVVLVAGAGVALAVLELQRDEPETQTTAAETQPEPAVRLSAACGEGHFTLEFDGGGAAIVRQGSDLLARASVDVREIACDAPVLETELSFDESPYHGELAGPSYESATFSCRTSALLELSVHPVLYRAVPNGSALVVADRHTRRLLAAANFARDTAEDRVWARAYWDEESCEVRR